MFKPLRTLFCCLVLCSVASVSFAQIQAVFPIQGEDGSIPELTFETLQNNGFSWFAAADATRFTIEVVRIADTFVVTNDYQNITEKNFSPPDSDKNFFIPARYTWTATITEGPNAGTSTESHTFRIVDDSTIIPTPTPTQVPEGEPTPTPEPPPSVGTPEIQFIPDQKIALSEILNFEIRWEEPAFPADAAFTYQIMIISPFEQVLANEAGLIEQSFKPVGLTQTGVYKVFLQATDIESGFKSLIAAESFEVAFQVTRTPTPTPRVISPDVTEDGLTNVVDIAQFVEGFNKQQGESGFLTQLDFVEDNVIDKKDLLVFINLFSTKNQQRPQAQWTTVDVPSFNFTGNQCIFLERTEIEIVNNEYSFEFQEDNNCNLSKINGGFTNDGQLTDGALFNFSAVEEAVNYEIEIVSELFGDQPKYFLDSQKFPNDRTGGKTFFHLVGFFQNEEILNITVTPVFDDQSLGRPSEVLRVVVPKAVFNNNENG